MGLKRGFKTIFVILFLFLLSMLAVQATDYSVSMNTSISKVVYGLGENIELTGAITQAIKNSTNITNATPLASKAVSINITYQNLTTLVYQNYTTNSQGVFYSKSDTFQSAIALTAPNISGNYYLIVTYTDPNATVWHQWLFFNVVQTVVDGIIVNTNKVSYIAAEKLSITAKAWKSVDSSEIVQSNITLNGTIRDSSEAVQMSFGCITNTQGICVLNTTAPSTVGTYRVEINNYTTSTLFNVLPFDTYVYMKDTTGKVLKSVYKKTDGASVEVQVAYNGTTPTGDYIFSGTIKDINGNIVKLINSTTLNSNNSYVDRFSFTIDSGFSDGYYTAFVSVAKSGGSTVTAQTSFEVRTWTLFVDPKQEQSGFQYGWSTFANKTVFIDILPLDTTNGTIITGVNTSTMTINVLDSAGNVLNASNATWNASCRTKGCYRAQFIMPGVTGNYKLLVKVDYGGEVQSFEQQLNIISTFLSATSTNEYAELKELFSTNEFIYVYLEGKNTQGNAVSITDADIESMTYYNGTPLTYTNISFAAVNASNNISEYGFNVSAQLLRIDTPKVGGSYNIKILANNKSLTVYATVKVNPYDICAYPKNTQGQVSSGYYYVSQFKTEDTIYLELIVKEASNPLGKATSANVSANATYGKGSGCTIDTATAQAVSNATVTIEEVVNSDTNSKATLNTTASVCQADDNSGKYTCTIQQKNNKWDSGRYQVKLKVEKNGIIDIDSAFFEAKSFYLYAYSSNWRNKPTQDIAFTLNMYQAGSNWWQSSTGLSGTVSLERVEYCGSEGSWLSSCVDIGYNTSGLNASTVTSGSGSLTLNVNRTTTKQWASGRYQAVLKATDSAGTVDYGKAFFEIRLFEAWANPIAIPTSGGCTYKSSFGNKENVSLYVRLTAAGNWNDNGGTSLGGPVYVAVKKILDVTSWPPKEISPSSYNATNFTVSTSSAQYWSSCNAGYILNISTPTGRWNETGYYNVIFDINGTETGSGWFNIKSFNVYTEPTNTLGTSYLYNTNGKSTIYFKVYTSKGEKYYQTLTESDYLNTTIQDMVLRLWDSSTQQTKELNYPEDINVTVNGKTTLLINGTNIINVSKKTGNWQTGYYYGEITLLDTENQTGKGYIYFNVQPFRVETSSSQYEVSASSNISATLTLRDPDWSTNSLLIGNYTVVSVYEDTWSNSGSTRYNYSFTPTALFNTSTNLTIIPNSNNWGSGSYGGYHYLNVVVKDVDNAIQSGWLSFKTVPFKVTISSIANVGITGNPVAPVTLQNPTSSASLSGNISKVYSWSNTGQKTYIFGVGSCVSNTSLSCSISGTGNVTVYAPLGGWDDGYTYLTFVFTDGTNIVESSSNFRATQVYTGWFDNYDISNNWKYYVGYTDNVPFKLNIRDSNNNPATVNITAVQYAETTENCWQESCKTYVTPSWALQVGGISCTSGSCFINITNPGVWKKDGHYVRATISGTAGTATINGGFFWVKDLTAPNLTISSPVIGYTYNTSFVFTATTTENTNCYITLLNYKTFKNWFCYQNNTGICNTATYSGDSYYYKYLGKDYFYFTQNESGTGSYSNGATGLSTGTTSHSYTFPIDMKNQSYGMRVYCYDSDWNTASGDVAFKINGS